VGDASGLPRPSLRFTLPYEISRTVMNWSEFFDMGGYALYVWASYGLMAIILVLNLILPMRRRTEVTERIRRLRAQSEKKV